MKRIDAIRSLRSKNPNIEARITINKQGYGIDELVALYSYLDYDDSTCIAMPVPNLAINKDISIERPIVVSVPTTGTPLAETVFSES